MLHQAHCEMDQSLRRQSIGRVSTSCGETEAGERGGGFSGGIPEGKGDSCNNVDSL